MCHYQVNTCFKTHIVKDVPYDCGLNGHGCRAQSDVKAESFNKTVKRETAWRKEPSTLEESRQALIAYIDKYNNKRFHSSIRYVATADKLNDSEDEILQERKHTLETAK